MTVETSELVPIKAAVIGLGGVGFRYDMDDSKKITTHAKAFHAHPAFDLVAGVDPKDVARSEFESAYDVPAYIDIRSLFRAHEVDVVALAVPTAQHYAVFCSILEFPVQLILCEKPLATSVAEGEDMLALAEKNRIALMVNYMRRFEPGVAELGECIQSGKLGQCYKGVVWYCNGLANNASHFIDLLILLFGPVSDCGLLPPNQDTASDVIDASLDFYLQWSSLRVCFLSLDECSYTCNEMEIFGTLGSVFYRNGGMNIDYRFCVEHPWFKDYKSLQRDFIECSTDLVNYQYHVVDRLCKLVRNGEDKYENASAALDSLRIVEQVRKLSEA